MRPLMTAAPPPPSLSDRTPLTLYLEASNGTAGRAGPGRAWGLATGCVAEDGDGVGEGVAVSESSSESGSNAPNSSRGETGPTSGGV